MKTKLCLNAIAIILLLALSSPPPAFCQVPQGFNYQAIARDGVTGNPITGLIDVKLAILSDDSPEVVVWEEIHYGVDPDNNGLFSIVLGQGSRVSGVTSFNLIDWTVTPKYIRTKIIYGGEKDMGSARIWSVPYAMVADSLGGPLKKLAVKGNTSNMEEPLFEVKNTAGKTVFAVYNEGVRIYVEDGSKGTKGGFAVGSFGDAKAPSQKYLYVSGDSIRAYIGPVPTGGKVSKGGFAVGGFDGTKEGTGEYLRVTRDSTRIYVNELGKTSKGGFAVGGFDGTKATVSTFTSLTPDNYLIGHNSGTKTTGKYNSFMGYEAGAANTTGERNTYLGYRSGYSNTSGFTNVFLGHEAGKDNTIGYLNTFLGPYAGMSNIDGIANVFIGPSAGVSNTSGGFNTIIGNDAGLRNEDGSSNVFLGNSAGYTNVSGQNNVLVGFFAGYYNTASYNLFLGYEAGYTNSTGDKNSFLGYRSGYKNTQGKENVFMGTEAGFSNTLGCYNVFIGFNSGYKNLGSGPFGYPGNYNVFLGYSSGYENETGQDNVFLGKQSGFWNKSGNANTFIGMNTGGLMTSASSNVLIGTQAGGNKTSGNNNTLVGSYAGYSSAAGASNVFIGFNAGSNETGSSLLYIENSDGASPLIGGDFSADKVAINGKPDPAGATLQVNGNLRVGNNGSNINNIIKVTIAKDLPSIAGTASVVETFSVPNTFISGAVMVSPQSALDNGLVISYARVSVNGTVEVKFRNNNASGSIDMGLMNWQIAVIQ